MGKKLTNMVEYELKGDLVSLEESVIHTQIVRKDKVDEDQIDLNEMLIEIHKFCNENIDKKIQFSLLMKRVEE